MSALRISAFFDLGIFNISIILKIMFLTSGAFTAAPVMLKFSSLIFFGFSIIVRTKYWGLDIGNTPINDVKFASFLYFPRS